MARRLFHTASAARSAAPPYTISITNQSGTKKSYALFGEAPTIVPAASERKVATGIIASVRGVSPGSGQASFILSKQLYVTCGTYDVEFESSDGNKKAVGTGTEVVDQRLIRALGSDGGQLGDLWEVDSKEGSPSFAAPEPQTGGAKGCFAVKTRGDFTTQEAKLGLLPLRFQTLDRFTAHCTSLLPQPPSSQPSISSVLSPQHLAHG